MKSTVPGPPLQFARQAPVATPAHRQSLQAASIVKMLVLSSSSQLKRCDAMFTFILFLLYLLMARRCRARLR